MTEELTFKTTQIGIFNPGRLTDEEIERAFVTRVKIFEYLLEGIVTESPEAIPQHYLIIGQRGMGKSTLLHRIAVELRKENYRKTFIPLTFPEEQYNVDRLSKFWLNCLDALADALDREGSTNQLDELDGDIRGWAAQAKDLTAMELYGHFADWAKRIGRRPVLLVDNLGLVFDRLSKEEQHQLRAILMDNGAPILVGASSNTLEDTVDYGAPFYDAFQIQYLKKLTFEETQDVLRNLAELTNNLPFVNEMVAQRGRLRTLYQLTGGTPRTIVMLYPLIQSGFSVEVQNDLESLMDVMTPLYKARFEELSEQMQVILDAVALHWDPIALDDLRQTTQLENPQLSPQLKRLIEVGWLERLDAYQKKGNAYQISERFFNIWYLMRRSSRRQKKELLCLTKFLVLLYGEELSQMGKRALINKSLNRDQVSMQLAIAGGVNDEELARKLKKKSWEELFEMSDYDPSVLVDFEIPLKFIDEKKEYLYSRATDFVGRSRWLDAYEMCQKILKIDPKDKVIWVRVGYLCMLKLHKYKEAESAYKKSIDIDPNWDAPWGNLGYLYASYLNMHEEAEKMYWHAIGLNDGEVITWNNLGNLYAQNLNKFSEAKTAYKKAIEIDPTHAPPWNNLGNVYKDHYKQYQNAKECYEAAIERDEAFIDSWFNLASLYSDDLHEYEKAEKAYIRALEIDSGSIKINLNLMMLYRDRMNRLEEAKNIFDKVDRSSLTTEYFLLNRSIFDLYDSNIGSAKVYLRKALLKIKEGKIKNLQKDWQYFVGIALRLGYGQEVLNILNENDYKMMLRPYYVAIQSLLAKDSEAFLNSIAVEVREVAADLAERIKRFM